MFLSISETLNQWDTGMASEETTLFERHQTKMTESETVSENEPESKSLRQRWKDHRDQIANNVSAFLLTNKYRILTIKAVWQNYKVGNNENKSTCQLPDFHVQNRPKLSGDTFPW